MGNYIRKKKEEISMIIKLFPHIVEAIKPTQWETPDVAIYIGKYMDEHPEKKITSHLRRKLKREYYCSLKEEKVRKEKE